MINFNEQITLKEDILKTLEGMTWKILPFGASYGGADREEVINVVPEFNENNKPVKGTIQFYEVKLRATEDSGDILEDDEIVVQTLDIDLIDGFSRRDKVKITFDRNAVTVKVRKFDVSPVLWLASMEEVGSGVDSVE